MMMDPDMDLKRRHSIDTTVVFLNSPENTPHYRNLNNQIISLYRRDTLDEICHLENIRVTIMRRVAYLEFLKNCRNENVLPRFT